MPSVDHRFLWRVHCEGFTSVLLPYVKNIPIRIGTAGRHLGTAVHMLGVSIEEYRMFSRSIHPSKTYEESTDCPKFYVSVRPFKLKSAQKPEHLYYGR